MTLYFEPPVLQQVGITPIYDQHHQNRFLISGRRGLINTGYVLANLSRQPLGEIRQQSLGIFPRYGLFVDNQETGTIKQMFGVWNEFAYVSKLNWIVMGNLTNDVYRVYRGVGVIMSVSSVRGGQVVAIDGLTPDDTINGILVAVILNHFSRVGHPLKTGNPVLGFD
ncbi:hypothetical protein [Lacticaseibacillus brantae]|uniref:Uncharacterized protein n=1 Tax=Lacticaseibacillus brantae DSM 23927 TaxID=1423727 RepID=A0A0R2AZV1_9LACO|nr:hypothetical protein [Lacticaseibacillus brantae]KRM72394.1 hypothetical protein FC34_GL000097 [Lacticaseibacillus brantae DSM 23927]